jgi:hypothetical protein
MRERSSGAGETRVIRYTLWRAAAMVPCGMLLALFAAVALYQPSSSLALILSFLVVLAICWIASRSIRLEITETLVRALQGGVRGHPNLEALRGEIREIHYYPMRISFQGEDRQPVMEPYPNWTLKQVLEVADLLGVPLYDHRGLLHLEELAVGRMVTRGRSDNSGS